MKSQSMFAKKITFEKFVKQDPSDFEIPLDDENKRPEVPNKIF